MVWQIIPPRRRLRFSSGPSNSLQHLATLQQDAVNSQATVNTEKIAEAYKAEGTLIVRIRAQSFLLLFINLVNELVANATFFQVNLLFLSKACVDYLCKDALMGMTASVTS